MFKTLNFQSLEFLPRLQQVWILEIVQFFVWILLYLLLIILSFRQGPEIFVVWWHIMFDKKTIIKNTRLYIDKNSPFLNFPTVSSILSNFLFHASFYPVDPFLDDLNPHISTSSALQIQVFEHWTPRLQSKTVLDAREVQSYQKIGDH